MSMTTIAQRVALTVACLSVCPGATALAQDGSVYVDDRSTPASLVRSLYNAVNRKEYARAWSYFGDEKPARTFEAYVAGFKDTSKVAVALGTPTSEGAAGSTFYDIPVAIEASTEGGDSKVFAGCYTARLANPQIQSDDFKPLHLVKGSLAPSDSPLDDAAPKSCGEGGEPGDDTILSQAKAAFAASNAAGCDFVDTTTGQPEREIADHTIKYRADGDGDSDPERVARLIGFPCHSGAYNFSTLYYFWDAIGGLRHLSFASPTLDSQYEEPDNSESALKSVTVNGFSTESELVNSEFDDKANTLTSWNKWRGVGDASSNGLWAFRNGEFVLVKFDVDASYNGEIDPQTVVDYDTAP